VIEFMELSIFMRRFPRYAFRLIGGWNCPPNIEGEVA